MRKPSASFWKQVPPTVLDADGLNLAAAMQWNLGEHVLATPPHGEIRRLLPDADNYAIRADIADCFLAEHEAALVYKGARTIVTQRGKPLFITSLGIPAWQLPVRETCWQVFAEAL